jgi:Uma2 family endonuclease
MTYSARRDQVGRPAMRGAAGRHDGQDRRAHRAYEPDAQVHCGERLADDTVIVPAPVIVVEVLSPSTATRDTGAKLADYFRLASLQHYLIVRTDRPTVIHHRRGDGDVIETHVVTAGSLQLDPPGIVLELDRVYG